MKIIDKSELVASAKKAMTFSYSPYSGFKVGAALLTSDGEVFTGCNIENSAFSPTACAERTAFFKAISEGRREFAAIAICGGNGGEIIEQVPPCGVCRQVMSEFCDKDFIVLLATSEGFNEYTLGELLPLGFTL